MAWCPKPGVHVVGATCGNSALLLDVAAALRGERAEDGDADGAPVELGVDRAEHLARRRVRDI